jgi:hypothetical protein
MDHEMLPVAGVRHPARENRRPGRVRAAAGRRSAMRVMRAGKPPIDGDAAFAVVVEAPERLP